MSKLKLARRAALGAFGAIVLFPAIALSGAEARARGAVGGITVDVAPLRENSGDPTAAWVARALPGALAEALAGVGRAGVPISARIHYVILGPSSGGTLAGGTAPDQMIGEVGEIQYARESTLELTDWIERYRSFALSQVVDAKLNLGTFVDFLLTEASTGRLESFLRTLRIYDAPRLSDPRFRDAVALFEQNQFSLPFKTPEKVDIVEDLDLTLSFESTLDRAAFSVNYNMFFRYDSLAIIFGKGSDYYSHDLTRYASISQRTILALGDCLKREERK